MGGDEFIMVALNCAESDIPKIKARWEKELEIVNEKYGMSPCSVAVGTAFARGSFQIEELCKIADDRIADKILKEKRQLKLYSVENKSINGGYYGII